MLPLPQLVSAALPGLVREAPLSAGKVEFAWRIAVGNLIAAVSTASLGPEGTIQIRVRDVRWRAEVIRLLPLITDRLEELLGKDAVRHVGVAD
jgi:hypothetical protein